MLGALKRLSTFSQYAEDVLSKHPVFLIGSGTSAGIGISGMGALASWLAENVRTDNFDSDELREWEQITLRLNQENMGLEQALQASGTNLTNGLTKEIVKRTWSLIARDERIALMRLSAGEDLIGFCRIFNRYKETTKNILHLIESIS